MRQLRISAKHAVHIGETTTLWRARRAKKTIPPDHAKQFEGTCVPVVYGSMHAHSDGVGEHLVWSTAVDAIEPRAKKVLQSADS